MIDTETKSSNILDRAFTTLIRWDGEKLAWAVLLIVAVLSRIIGLGDRAMSHDESLHTVYSWQLYDGRGYQHQPMMHGPLKFILNAVMYFLFGVNDWSSRIQVALFGVLMIALVWLMRRWLGKVGAFLAAAMFTISPALLYHSRYIRDEVMLCALLVLLVIAMFRYLETRSARWLNWTAVALGLAFLTMEASFIFGGVFGIFLVVALAAQLWAIRWPDEGHRTTFRAALTVAVPALVLGLLLVIFKQKIAGYVLLGIGGVAGLGVVVLTATSWRGKLRFFAELDLIFLLGTLVLPFTAALVLKLLGWQISQFSNPGQITFALVWQGALVVGILFIASIALGWFWLRGRWLAAAGLFWAIELLFFTTFLTNGQGIGTGLIGSLGYWVDQQEVMRGGQPWYYFLLLVSLYEFLPLLLGIGGVVAWIAGWGKRGDQETSRRRCCASDVDKETRKQGESAVEQGSASRGAGERRSKGVEERKPATNLPIYQSTNFPISQSTTPPFSIQTLFDAFLVFWVAATWGVFTYVGEKMPWHTVYFAMSMALLGAWWLGRVVEGIDWRAGRAKGLFWLIGMTPLFLFVLKALLPTSTHKPFADVTVAGLSNSAQWLLALIAGMLLIYFLYDRFVAVGWRQGLRGIAVSLAGILAVFTVAVAFRFAFINYDYPVEPMVYAHATPDIKLAMNQVEEISRKTVGDHAIKVAYDDDATWPLEWYLRDYPNKAYYAANPSRDNMDSPVVIVGDKNIGKVRPYLGDRYYEFNYRLIWWPRETYKALSWQRIRDGIQDPVQRGQFWNVVIHRRYTTTSAQWDPIHRFSLFVRKDVAAQVWDWGAPTAAVTTTGEVYQNPYEGGQQMLTALQQIGATGAPGAAAGQFNFPRAVAVDAEGKIYVADSGNHRVQIFNPDGSFLRQFGSACKLDTGEGCQGDGRGQFNEPWGIAVAADGSIYVSDTWNHRIQKFDNQGAFVTMWGRFESTGGELGAPSVFYGPRSLVVGQDGNIYVMDTGNKRVQLFAPDGQFVAQYGGGGVIEGRLDEPVGLAQDSAGNWYVADTWNRRIQKFDRNFVYLTQWSIDGWASQSVVNKPALAVDGARNIVYAVDPENYRVLAFNTDGNFRATFGLYGNDAQSFTLPTGIAVGLDGRIYVADGDSHRIMVFSPLQ